MAKKVNKKIKAYELFAQGYEPSSPEVKALKLKYTTLHTYYSNWKTGGQPSPLLEEEVEGKSKAKAKAVKAKIPLPGGESIQPLGEIELILAKGEEEESKENQREVAKHERQRKSRGGK